MYQWVAAPGCAADQSLFPFAVGHSNRNGVVIVVVVVVDLPSWLVSELLSWGAIQTWGHLRGEARWGEIDFLE